MPEIDYLDEDKEIRGQKYVCVSFLSPEDTLKEKEVFYFEEYIKQFANDMSELFDGLKARYPELADLVQQSRENNAHLFNGRDLEAHYKFFKTTHSERIESAFHEKHNFQTSVRGIKVRGSYETLKDAQTRAELLKKMGDKFDIFVAQVGCWCPWSPNPEDMEVEYAEANLQNLMKKYSENMTLRDVHYEQRKRSKIEDAQRRMQESLLDNEKEDAWLSAKVKLEPSATADATPADAAKPSTSSV